MNQTLPPVTDATRTAPPCRLLAALATFSTARGATLGATLCAALLALPFAAAPTAVLAQAAELPTVSEARGVNERTVGVVFHYENSYRQLLADITKAMEESDAGVRMVPMIGGSHVQTVYDMLYLDGVDLGITHSDVVEFMARVQDYGRGYAHIRNLAEIATEKVAIIAGEGIESIEDLAGKKVNVRYPGSGADVTGTIVFDILGIEVEKTRFDKVEALEKIRSGEIAATVYLIEEPEEAFTALSPDDGVTLLELPRGEELLEHYRPSKLEPEDFPALISEGSAIPTLAVPVVIAAYNWTPGDPFRYEKVRRFASAFMENFETIRENDEEGRWESVSLEAEVPGLERYAVIGELLAERDALERQRETEARETRIAELSARREALIAQLTGALDGDSADPAEIEELEKLVEEFQQRLESDE